MRKFRFGVVAARAESAQEWLDKARRVEQLGFNTLLLPDGLQHSLSPFPALAAAAASTTTLRVGTYVLANDYRHPVALAGEAATLDLVSSGRFELGIGAGRPSAAQDNGMLGMRFDNGKVRVARLAEALRILKPLLSRQSVDINGDYYQVPNASMSFAPVQQPLPILIGASQRQLLGLAAHEADMIALAIAPGATAADVDDRIGWIRDAAGRRSRNIELNISLMAVAEQVPHFVQTTMGAAAATLAQSDAIPVLNGSLDQMCDRLTWLRERFGISYLVASDELLEAFAPVVARMRGA